MIASAKYVWASAFALALAACGGGGGGGGGFPAAASTGSTSTASTSTTSTGTTASHSDDGTATDTSSAASGPTISAKRGTTALSADASGAYDVKPGPLAISSTLPITNWTFSSPSGSPVTITRDAPPFSSYGWSGKLDNDTGAPQTLILTASYLEGGETKTRDIVINVAAADARNASFAMFSVYGPQYQLDLDFDYGSYSVSNVGGMPFRSSGTFEEDGAEPGTFLMKEPVSRYLPFNPYRFRMSADTVVGAYALPSHFTVADSSRYVTPFIAVKSSVPAPSAIDGVYTVMQMRTADNGDASTSNTSYSRVGQVKVAAGGTTFTVCDETNTISQFASCMGTLVTYTGTPDTGYESAAGDRLNIKFVSLGGETVLLSSDPGSAGPSELVFRIGVPDNSSDWTQTVARGGDKVGTWSKYTVGPASIAITGTRLDGVAMTADVAWSPPYPTLPQNLRMVAASSYTTFAMQSSKLLVAMGIGYGISLQIALKD